MPSTKSKLLDSHASQTFRRGTTVTWAVVMTIIIVGTAGLLSAGFASRGFLAVIAPILCVAPLLAFVVFACFWPAVIVAEDAVTVQNSYASYRIPYPAIKDLAASRIGLFIRLHEGGRVPVTAYVSGSTAKLFGHPKALAALVSAIEDRMAASPETAAEGAEGTTAVRTVLTTNIALTLGSFVLVALGIWAATAG